MNIKVLLDAGYRISEASRLSEEEMASALNKILTENVEGAGGARDVHISNMVSSALDFDLAAFEKNFAECLKRWGFATTVETVMYPLMQKIGILWQQNKIHPSQEHFISNLARQKIFAAIDGMAMERRSSQQRYILFLPEFEDHEIGLLYTYYLLARAGIPAIYLGPRVPLPSLEEAVERFKPTHLFFFVITRKSSSQITSYIKSLRQQFVNMEILASGRTELFGKIALQENIKIVQDPGQFKQMIRLE